MKMNTHIKNVSVTIGSVITIITGLWFLAQPAFDAHVKDLIREYVSSQEYIIQEREIARELFIDFLDSGEFEEKLDEYLDRVNSNSVSLRKLLSIKMGVPQESVADRLADLYVKDSKRLRKLLIAINIKYPELNLWEID